MLHCFAGTEMVSIGSPAVFVCAAVAPRRGQLRVYYINTNPLTAAPSRRTYSAESKHTWMASNKFTNKTGSQLFLSSAQLLGPIP